VADRKLIIQIIGDDSSLHRALGRSSRDTQNFGRSMQRVARGGIVASVGFRGLGRSVAFASGAFLGGAGFITVVRNSINAAVEQSKILANLRNSLETSGKSWAQYGQEIQHATEHTKRLSAFDDEELFASLQRLIRGTGSVNIGLRANAVAANLARGANIGLDQGSKALLRAYNGQTAGLSRLGVQIDKGVKGTAALDAVQRKFAGASEAFSNSAAGAQERFNVGIHDIEKAIGRGLLPQFVKLTDAAADWLNSSENQEKVQRAVAGAVKQGEGALQGFLDVMKPLASATGEVTSALGGTRNAVRLLLAAMVASKVVAFSRSLGLFEARTVAATRATRAFTATQGIGLARSFGSDQAALAAASTRMRSTADNVKKVGKESQASALRVNQFRAALARLAAVAVITIAIELVINRKSIERQVDDFLKGHGLGFLAGTELDLPVNVTLPDLRKAREQVASLKGENDLMVKALDKAIARFGDLDKQRLDNAERGVARLRRQLDGVKGKQVTVSVVQRGLTKVEKQVAGIKSKSVEVRVVQKGVEDLQHKLDGIRGKTVPVDFFETGLREIARKLNVLRGKRLAIRVTQTGLDKIVHDLAGVKGKTVNVAVALKNLREVQRGLAGVKNKTVTVQVLEQGVRDLIAKLSGVKGKQVTVEVLEQGIADLKRKLDAVTHDRTLKVHVEIDAAQNLVDQILAPLQAAQALAQQKLAQAKLAVGRSRRRFEAGVDRRALELDQAQTQGAQAELREIARQEAIVREQIRVQGHTVALDRQLFDLEQQRTQVLKDLADQRKASAEAAKSAAQARFQSIISAIQAKIDRLDTRGQLRREITALNQEERAVRDEIRVEGRTADLEQQLQTIEEKRAEIRKRIAEARKQRTQSRQFEALGLTAEGEERTPSRETLRRRLASLREQIKGTTLDTAKTRSELEHISRVLRGQFGKTGRDVRDAIKKMLDDIADALSGKTAGGSIHTAFKKQGFKALLTGLGLTPDQERELRSRLEQRGPGGVVPSKGVSAFGMAITAPAPVTTTTVGPTFDITINGNVVTGDAEDFIRQMQRKAQRSRASRRGVRAGKNRGLS
jgi:hypothetical protein